MFRHPSYYKNLRKLARNRDPHVRPISGSVDSATDQAISKQQATASSTRSLGPGLQQVIEETVPHNDIEEAASAKRQASSVKPQASEDTSDKHQAPSSKRQA